LIEFNSIIVALLCGDDGGGANGVSDGAGHAKKQD
jgi:hypothetical protein